MGVVGLVVVARFEKDRAAAVGEALAGPAQVVGVVGVFAPAAGGGLERDNTFGDEPGFGAAIPGGGAVEGNGAGIARGGGRERGGGRGGEIFEFGGEEGLVGGALADGAVEVVAPRGLLGGGQGGDALGGERERRGIGADHGGGEPDRKQCDEGSGATEDVRRHGGDAG